jgi:hypothetical protein
MQSSHKNLTQSVHNVVALACTSSLKHGSQNSSVIIYSINENEIMKLNLKHDGAISGAGTAYPSGAPDFIPGF